MPNITIDEDHLYKLMVWLATAAEEELIAVARPAVDRSRTGAVQTIALAVTDDHSRASHPTVIPGLVERDLLPSGWA